MPPDILRDHLGASAATIADATRTVAPAALLSGTGLRGRRDALAGRCVLLDTSDQLAAAMAMLELDGLVRRLVVAPPDLRSEDRAAVVADAGVELVVGPRDAATGGPPCLPYDLSIAPAAPSTAPRRASEWVLLTSGTTGRPKMVVHSLAALTGAIRAAPRPRDARVWATFYDIRRYGGLQILLRALLGAAPLVLAGEGEALAAHLARLGRAGVTHMSGTPSHWRRVLMSPDRQAIAPRYIRLSGEIADQAVLDGLRRTYPGAGVGHAYASTEAGVGFDVDDGLEGFPAALAEDAASPVAIRVVDGTLRLRSARTASAYVGPAPAALFDAQGFVDTGDMVERRGARYHFVGRRGGIVNVGGLNVHPEEVEAAINAHPKVRMALARGRRNAFTGSIVVADVVPAAAPALDAAGDDALKAEILALCRRTLDPHKVPAAIRFVPALAITPTGKLSRRDA